MRDTLRRLNIDAYEILTIYYGQDITDEAQPRRLPSGSKNNIHNLKSRLWMAVSPTIPRIFSPLSKLFLLTTYYFLRRPCDDRSHRY